MKVMKFGGTSVASAENRAAAIGHIRAELEQLRVGQFDELPGLHEDRM